MEIPEYAALPALILPKNARKQEPKEESKETTDARYVDYELVERLATAGLTRKQFSLALSVTMRTMNRIWRSKRFLEALKRGREQANAIVKASLYQRATGFTTEEVEYKLMPVIESKGSAPAVYDKDEDYEKALIPVKRIVKHIVPSDVACIFWLTNRAPDQWKDVKNVVSENKPIQVEGLPTDLEGLTKLAQMVKRMKEQKRTEEETGKLQVGPDGVKVSLDGGGSAPTVNAKTE